MEFHEFREEGETTARHVLYLLTVVLHGIFWGEKAGI